MRSIITTITSAIILLICNIQINAQWVNNPINGMTTVTNEAGYDHVPQIVPVSNNRYLVTWRRSTEHTIKYQVVDQFGNNLLEQNGRFMISGDWWNGGVRYQVPNGSGGTIIVFTDWRSGNSQIYGQRIDSDGNRLWGENGIQMVLYPEGGSGLRDVVIDTLGSCFIAWSKNISPINQIYVQKVNLNTGERLWGDMGINDCTAPAICDIQQIVADGEGGVIDVWSDQRYGGDFGKLFAQHLDVNGNPLWTPNGIPICDPNTGEQLWETVDYAVPDGQGGGIWVNELPTAHVFNLFRLTGSGRVSWIWTHGGVETYGVVDIIRHPRDSMIWATSYEPDYYHLYRFNPLTGQQFFGPNGLRVGGQTIVPVQDGVIVLEGQMTPNGNLSAYRVNNGGHLVWQSYVVLHVYLGELGSHAAVSDSSDGAVVAFEDNRISIWADISAQRILANGRLGIPNPPHAAGDNTTDASGLSLRIEDGEVSYLLPAAGEIQLELYDILGKKIAVIEAGYRSPGEYSIKLNEEQLPSGVYLLKLTTHDDSRILKIAILH